MSSSSSSTDDNTTHKRRVVVTGLGVISGCGIGATDFFDACCDGKSSLRKVQRFDIQHYPCQIASEVPEELFDPANFFNNPKNIKSNDRYTHFAVAAARQALQDGQYGDTPDTLIHPERIGVMVGTAFGGMETFEQETLKLHKKPERPKVRKRPLTCDRSFCIEWVTCHLQISLSLPNMYARFHHLRFQPCWAIPHLA